MRGCLKWGFIGLGLFFVLIIIAALVTPSDEQATDASTPVVSANLAVLAPTATPGTMTQPVVAPTTAPGPTVPPTITFTRDNWAQLVSDPNAYKGADVDIVGRVFATVERNTQGTGWQMFADVKNREWNTIVFLPDPNYQIDADNYVHVIGTVEGALEGRNAFGGEVIAPSVRATQATIVGAVAAASPPLRTAEINQQQDQHGLVLAIERIEFAPDETRVFLRMINGSSTEATFYSFNARAVQGSTQFDAETFHDYGEVQSQILPGVETSGVLLFGAMDPVQPATLYLEARTDDYALDFTPYVFQVE